MFIILAYINSRSINKKADTIRQYIADEKIDVMALTETWLKGTDEDRMSCGDITPPGYTILHVPRKGKRGGGVGLVFRSNLQIKQCETTQYGTFEHMEVLILNAASCTRLSIIYRPPNTDKGSFLHELESFVSDRSTMSGNLVIVGDFNINISTTTSPAASMKELLHSMNLVQHINEPTHDKGGTLDLVMTRAEESMIHNINIIPVHFSDHHMIMFKLPWKKEAAPKKVKTTENIKTSIWNLFGKTFLIRT